MGSSITAWTANGENLLDWADAVILENEGGAGKRGSNLSVGGVDGERFEPKPYAAKDLILRIPVSYTDASGLVTHPDGGGGHFFENMSNLERVLGGPGPVLLGREVPGIGLVQARCDCITGSIPTAVRFVYKWVLRNHDGSWQDQALSDETGNPPAVVTSGDRRIHDPEIEFSAAGVFTHTDTDGVESVLEVETGPVFPVIVRRVDGVWEATDAASADASQFVVMSRPWGIRLDADVANTIATTVACTVRWRNRWK